ncbi:MAG: SurA N-terminal domain-containing protein [Steroidobacteraceae bacterium]
MLQSLNDALKRHRWLSAILLGAIAMFFVVWGAYGVVNMDFFSRADEAARVNGVSVPRAEAVRAWQDQQSQWQRFFGGEIPAERQAEIKNSVLEGLVRRALIKERATDLGYRVSPQRLREAILREPAFQVDGKYNADVARARLAQAGISESQYEREVEESLLRGQLEGGMRVSAFITPTELARIFALEDEQREISYLELPYDKFTGDGKVDEADIRKRYEAEQQRFLTPESVKLEYAELRLDEVKAQVKLADGALEKYYADNRDKFVEPERRKARHILIKVAEAKDDAAAKARAEKLLAEVKGGADFAELARANSDDGGSAAQGGDLGWAERSYFVGPFSDALFAMQPGEIRGPIKTQFGYHIIKLEEIQPERGKSFDAARPEIEARLREQEAADVFGDRQEAIQHELESGNSKLADVAASNGMRVEVVDEYLKGAGGGSLGADRDLNELVFSDAVLNQGRIGGPVFLGDDRMILVKVTLHRKPEPRALDTVANEIKAEILRERGTASALAAARQTVARLSAGQPFADSAKALGVEAEPARFIGRADPAVPAKIRELVFQQARPDGKPRYFSVELDNGGAAVVQFSAVRAEPSAADGALRAQHAEEMLRRHAEADAAAYLEEARRQAQVTIRPDAFN